MVPAVDSPRKHSHVASLTVLLTLLLLAAPLAGARVQHPDTPVVDQDGEPTEVACQGDLIDPNLKHGKLDYVLTARPKLLTDTMTVKQYEWTVNGEFVVTYDPQLPYEFSSYGPHTIKLKLVCKDLAAPVLGDPLLEDRPIANDTEGIRLQDSYKKTTQHVNGAGSVVYEAQLIDSPLITRALTLLPPLPPEPEGSVIGGVRVVQNTVADGGLGQVGPEKPAVDEKEQDAEDEQDTSAGSTTDDSEGNAGAVDDSGLAAGDRGLMGSSPAETAVGIGMVIVVLSLVIAGLVSTTKWIKSRWHPGTLREPVLVETSMGLFTIAADEKRS